MAIIRYAGSGGGNNVTEVFGAGDNRIRIMQPLGLGGRFLAHKLVHQTCRELLACVINQADETIVAICLVLMVPFLCVTHNLVAFIRLDCEQGVDSLSYIWCYYCRI